MTGAEIAIHDSGRHLYASNRSGTGGAATAGPGEDTVTVMSLDGKDYLPEVSDIYSTGGLRPRFIGTDTGSKHLFAANEISDTITGFTLSAIGKVTRQEGIVARTGSPVCILTTPTPTAK